MKDAERKLKDEVVDFFRSTPSATPELKTQVAGFVDKLADQAQELRGVVKAAKEWVNRNHKRARVKRKSPTTRTRR